MHLPRQRRLGEGMLQETKSMLDVKANKKMVQQHIYQQSGKVVTLKDLHNMASDTTAVNAEILIEEMRKVEGKK